MMQTALSIPATLPQQLDLTLDLGPTLLLLLGVLLVGVAVTALSVAAGSRSDERPDVLSSIRAVRHLGPVVRC